jgi:hypothetical protein
LIGKSKLELHFSVRTCDKSRFIDIKHSSCDTPEPGRGQSGTGPGKYCWINFQVILLVMPWNN